VNWCCAGISATLNVRNAFQMLRRLRQLTTLGLTALCLWVAAPALSTTPFMPEAVDFEQRLPEVRAIAPSDRALKASAAHEEGPVTHRSGVIEAPTEFDLVGLAGEMRPVELRVRSGDDAWSEWVEIASGEPLYTGGTDELELRTRGWRPSGRLHYVNVSGTTSTADSLLNRARGAINDAFISATTLFSGTADADARRPDVVRRGQWGANRDQGGCKPRRKPSYGKVKAAAIHHTVTANGYSRSEAPGIVLAICRYHRNGNDWNDIGYNVLVDRFGTLYEGRDGGLNKPVMGAQTQGFNDQTTGLAVIGSHSNTEASRKAINGASRFLAWKFSAAGIPARGKVRVRSGGGEVNPYPKGKRLFVKRIFPHGRLNTTACPGQIKGQLRRLKSKTHSRMN
jgi:hypothetical protein